MVQIELPAGSHYALTAGIPERYGGMTASMLQRSRAFVAFADVEVTVLTYDYRDYSVVRRQLRDRGATIDGIHVANLWEDLRGWNEEQLKPAVFDRSFPEDFEPLGDRGAVSGPLSRQVLGETGLPHQTDHFRPDGTLLASDRQLSASQDRVVVLCDRSGEPLGAWSSITHLYALWFDSLPRDPIAWMIVDSKSSAAMVAGYQRPDVVKMHVVRGSHLRSGADGPMGDLVSSRASVMENLDAWDSVNFLTESQRADVEARFGQRANLYVIPNSRNVPAALPRRMRRRGRGAMLASLDGRKRIGHAIRAMVAAQRRFPRRRLALDVWGDGELESELRKLIKAKRAPVKLRGHSPSAVDSFSRSTFSLLTSRAEAFGNVLIESMGRGCIPISYDVRYGPSDIITHGVDGFLVPDGDIKGLADQICTLVKASPADLARLREAGHRRALDFNDENAVQRWSASMAAIATRRGFAAP